MKFDLVIVGAGIAGLSLAVALRSTPLSIAIVEARAGTARAVNAADAAWDTRIYALSPANQRFFASIGAWQHFARERMAPVRRMEISGDAGGRLEFSAYDSGVDELAWIVEASLLQNELWQTVKRQGNVTVLCPATPAALTFDAAQAHLVLADGRALSAALIVAADGADSWTRRAAGIAVDFKLYGALGVVANFSCATAHDDCAYQWFRHDGVLAWLPLPGNRLSMVWSTPEAEAQELLGLSAAELCDRVALAGNWCLGELQLLTPAAAFPLRMMRAPRSVMPRLALIGDAAHCIHPLSGHGLNLGLQDSQVLARLLAERPDYIDCGDERLLRRYERERLEQVLVLQSTTDALQRLFRPQHALLSLLRNAGLNFTNTLPVVRDALVRYALG